MEEFKEIEASIEAKKSSFVAAIPDAAAQLDDLNQASPAQIQLEIESPKVDNRDSVYTVMA